MQQLLLSRARCEGASMGECRQRARKSGEGALTGDCDPARTKCYWSDQGCGYQCLDRFVEEEGPDAGLVQLETRREPRSP